MILIVPVISSCVRGFDRGRGFRPNFDRGGRGGFDRGRGGMWRGGRGGFPPFGPPMGPPGGPMGMVRISKAVKLQNRQLWFELPVGYFSKLSQLSIFHSTVIKIAWKHGRGDINARLK